MDSYCRATRGQTRSCSDSTCVWLDLTNLQQHWLWIQLGSETKQTKIYTRVCGYQRPTEKEKRLGIITRGHTATRRGLRYPGRPALGRRKNVRWKTATHETQHGHPTSSHPVVHHSGHAQLRSFACRLYPFALTARVYLLLRSCPCCPRIRYVLLAWK